MKQSAQLKKIKICFAASSGGHFEQLLMLRPLMEQHDSFVLTEKTAYRADVPGQKTHYMHQVNRREKLFPIWMLFNCFRTLIIYLKEKPNIVITTGVLAMIPMCLLVKLTGGKLVFIESFAKVTSPT